MNTVQDIAPPKARWDLSALFDSPEDPRIEQTWARVLERAQAFAQRYRGKINSPDLTAETLATALKEIEEMYRDCTKPANYANLLFTCDSSDPKLGAFLQKQMEKGTELNVLLMFFELELQAASGEILDRISKEPAMSNYAHYLQVARTYSPYRLSEPEEIILEETANVGIRGWVRLYEETLSTHIFKFQRPGSDEIEELTEEEVTTLMREPDRELRKAGADCLTEGLKEVEHTVTFIYNQILQDRRLDDRLRKFDYPEQSRNMSNELDRETVDLVVRLCKEHYGLVERFYNVKREILGLPELTHYDRYAPLSESKQQISYDDARQIILKAFGEFSPTMANRAEEFFTESWIDAEPRKGKQGGAFCSYNTPDTHPVVFMNYLNKVYDVMTLAHELGHGVHASLSREQSFLNYQGTLPLAELASIFGEMLVFESITANASDSDKLAMYAGKIEGMFASVFRQVALFSFEKRAHVARREEGELDAESLGEIWQEEVQNMFGNSIQLGEQHAGWWLMVGHFFFAPFYVYAYAFGELLVLSLYQKAKREGPSFAEKYEKLLRLGGSRSPQELMDTVGVSLHSEEFWMGGFEAMEKMVVEFERLWAIKKSNG